jgi:mannose-6-phosphate isomerase
MMEPITFRPLLMERVWGGRRLESLYGRELPREGVPYGESWEFVDRPEAQSVVTEGCWAGRTLHDLWTGQRAEIWGPEAVAHPAERFPILIKILDAQDTLSIQVHPPVHEAVALHGEPKTEMWVITEAEPDSALYVGVQPGTTRESFAQAMQEGTVEQAVHRLRAKTGDFMFIRSGRLHAIGAGLVIFEIQQNSDTTYRVFDWNRVGLDGKPRDLHLEESLRCIDYTDTAPTMDQAAADGTLVACEYFTTRRVSLLDGQSWTVPQAAVIAITKGRLRLSHVGGRDWQMGDFFLLSHAAVGQHITPGDGGEVEFLCVTLPASPVAAGAGVAAV